MRADMKKGSALIMVIWTIAVLSVIVMSFAVEAKLQSAVNVYVRERAKMDRLIDAGKVLAEMVISSYDSVPEYSEDENLDELLEDDRWIQEKRQLKQTGASALIGPIAIDELNPDDGTVTVEIESVGGGEGGGPKFNINTLYPGGHPHFAEIWENILYWAGVPEDDHEYFLNAWLDWRDEDDATTSIAAARRNTTRKSARTRRIPRSTSRATDRSTTSRNLRRSAPSAPTPVSLRGDSMILSRRMMNRSWSRTSPRC